jgi:hypothetical protein
MSNALAAEIAAKSPLKLKLQAELQVSRAH